MARLLPLFSVLLLALGLACGGSTRPSNSAPPTAQGLAYTDPTTTGWRLVKDPSSTATRLLLNLVGPGGVNTRGAGFNLKASAGVRFGAFPDTGLPLKDLGVYDLWNTDPLNDGGSVPPGQDPLEPRLLAGGVKPGNVLTVGVFQKDRRATAKASGRPLFQVALEFDPSARLVAGETLTLTVLKARHMAEDIGAFSVAPTLEMARKAVLVDMPVAVGSLHAN